MKKKIVIQYYVLSFLLSAFGLSIISAIYATFMIKHGLNLFEINVVNTTYFVTLFVCEIPTGVFADVFGRKKSFIVSSGFLSLSMFIYGCSDSMSGFILAEIVGAFGVTFKTGAFDAWLVDSLGHYGHHEPCTKIFALGNVVNQVAAIIGAIIGAYVSVVHPSFPWFLGSIGLVGVTILAAIIMKEEYFVKKTRNCSQGITEMKKTTILSFKYATQEKSVRFVLLITSIQVFAVMSINMYWQPFFGNMGVAEKNYGWIFMSMIVMLGLGSFVASRIDSVNKEKHILIWSQIVVGVCLIGVFVTKMLPVALAFFVLHEFGRGFWGPMKSGYLHSRIPSSERATVVSFCEIIPHISGALGLLASGLIANSFGVIAAWFVSALLLIVSATIFVKNGNGSSHIK